MGTRREQLPRKPPTRKQPPRKVKSVPLKQSSTVGSISLQLKKHVSLQLKKYKSESVASCCSNNKELKKYKSESVASCCSNNKEWITAKMSVARHVWTTEDHHCMVEMMKDSWMVYHYNHSKDYFLETIRQSINELPQNRRSVPVDLQTVEEKVENFLSNMKNYHKLEEPSIGPTLSRDVTVSYFTSDATSSGGRSKKSKKRTSEGTSSSANKRGKVPIVFTDKNSVMRYLNDTRVVSDSDLADYSIILDDKNLLELFKLKKNFSDRIHFLKEMVKKEDGFFARRCVLNREDFLGIPR